MRLPDLKRVLRFALFGLLGTLVDFATFQFLIFSGVEPPTSKAASYLVALAFTVLFISRFVFRVHSASTRRVQIFFLYLATGFLNVLVFSVLSQITLGLNPAFFIATLMSAAVNYWALKALTQK